MNNFRARFTNWYYRKGYRMRYQPCDYADGVAEMVFHCPWWVRPWVEFFFSPSIYYHKVFGEIGTRLGYGLKGE